MENNIQKEKKGQRYLSSISNWIFQYIHKIKKKQKAWNNEEGEIYM